MVRSKALLIHTVMGPITAASDELARLLLEDIALDAVRQGKGDERPWIVDHRGKPVRPMLPYTSYLGPRSLVAQRGDLSPPARIQNEELTMPLLAAQEFQRALWALHDVKASKLLDPIARAVLIAEVRNVVVPLLRTLDGCEGLADEVEKLYPRAPHHPADDHDDE